MQATTRRIIPLFVLCLFVHQDVIHSKQLLYHVAT